ncbi:MAG: ABC transporter permease [Chloroflexi bacterium]|nr:ABC transporter permease [Chloroflexota bacterium]
MATTTNEREFPITTAQLARWYDIVRESPPVVFGIKWLKRFLFSEYFILYLTIIYFLIMTERIQVLDTPLNLTNVLANAWPLLAIAIGQTFVLLTAGIDLSQTSVMAITSVVGAALMTTNVDPLKFQNSILWGNIVTEEGGLLAGHQYAVELAILAMLGIGLFIGFLNGMAIARFRMPPFMVTLVSMTFFSALAIYLTQSNNIRGLPEDFIKLGEGDIISIYVGEQVRQISRRDVLSFVTYPLLIAAGLGIVAHVVLSRTVFGRHVYAVGTNARAAEVSGVPTKRTIILVYMFSGFCAAVAGIIYSGRLQAGRPTLGENLLLDVVGATVIGGTSLFGGKGKVLWTFFGVLFFVLLSNTLNLLKLSAFEIDIVKGSIILLAALIDVTRTRLLARES